MRSKLTTLVAVLTALALAAPVFAKPREKRVRLRTRVEIRYVVDGPRDAPPIIFLHGVTDSSHSWSSVMPHLADDYRVYALDQRGHGDSEKPLYGYSMTQFAEDVHAFMKRRRIPRAIVVGHSMGSIIAHHFAALYPEKVSHLVLLASTPSSVDNPVVNFLWDEIIGLPDFQDPISRDFIREWQTGPNPVDPVFFEKVIDETAKVPARVWKAAFRGLLIDDHTSFLDNVTMPTLIIWGTEDAIFSQEEQDALLDALPHAEFAPYDGGGHNIQWEQPQRVADDIRAFVE